MVYNSFNASCGWDESISKLIPFKNIYVNIRENTIYDKNLKTSNGAIILKKLLLKIIKLCSILSKTHSFIYIKFGKKNIIRNIYLFLEECKFII